ncbi:hypothetical protein FB45DRAFT_870652 [Roridomyces roridus]|uniref:F-box domain-containing protein n=1 Tax=Roridomyces roridus TaxID=1738132 RepID=A0AAD7BJF7_9AGAR|nr:hypothetical protein FB45DRAFT_870652 [Roridomyces roridus]
MSWERALDELDWELRRRAGDHGGFVFIIVFIVVIYIDRDKIEETCKGRKVSGKGQFSELEIGDNGRHTQKLAVVVLRLKEVMLHPVNKAPSRILRGVGWFAVGIDTRAVDLQLFLLGKPQCVARKATAGLTWVLNPSFEELVVPRYESPLANVQTLILKLDLESQRRCGCSWGLDSTQAYPILKVCTYSNKTCGLLDNGGGNIASVFVAYLDWHLNFFGSCCPSNQSTYFPTSLFIMHRCFNLPELVTLVAQNVDLADLCSLARSCRDISPCALDELWKHQESLVPLLKCLPADAWHESGGSFDISRPLYKEDWDRLIPYCRRIRSLDDRLLRTKFESLYGITQTVQNSVNGMPGQSSCSCITTQAIQSVVMTSPEMPVLGNVNTVHAYTSSPWFPYIALFLGSNMATFHVTTDGQRLNLSALSRLSQWANLKTLHVRGGSAEWTGIISPYLKAATFQSLRKLSIEDLHDGGWEAVARLPHLLCLEVGDPRRLSYGQAVRWIGTGVTFLESVTHAPLTNITVHVRESTYDHFRLLPVMNTASDLRPLLDLVHLASLTLSSPHGITFDDAFAEEMCLAWPKIQKLSFGPWNDGFRQNDVPSMPTATALMHFSKHCALLHTLDCIVDISGLSGDAESPRGIRQSMLSSINIRSTVVKHPFGFAKLLSSLFPNLQSILSVSTDSTSSVDDTLTVLVRQLASVRKDERANALHN